MTVENIINCKWTRLPTNEHDASTYVLTKGHKTAILKEIPSNLKGASPRFKVSIEYNKPQWLEEARSVALSELNVDTSAAYKVNHEIINE